MGIYLSFIYLLVRRQVSALSTTVLGPRREAEVGGRKQAPQLIQFTYSPSSFPFLLSHVFFWKRFCSSAVVGICFSWAWSKVQGLAGIKPQNHWWHLYSCLASRSLLFYMMLLLLRDVFTTTTTTITITIIQLINRLVLFSWTKGKWTTHLSNIYKIPDIGPVSASSVWSSWGGKGSLLQLG